MSANDELQAHTCEKMLEFYGKPQDYVKKSHNEQDLTEQWKKGELESGWYYTQVGGFKEVSPDLYDKDDNSWLCDSDKDLQPLKVLASVPSYEEQQEEQRALKVLAKAYCKKERENQQLKELLKRCRDFINYEVPDHCIDDVLLDKINEVLK